MRRSSARFSTSSKARSARPFCTALRTIHDTFEAKRKRMIEQGKLPNCPPQTKKGGHCR
ncbi:MAG: hypothetical protein ACLRSD_11930 [Oscillibacter sp.]